MTTKLLRVHDIDPIGGYVMEVLTNGIWEYLSGEDLTKTFLDEHVDVLECPVGYEEIEPGHIIHYYILKEN